jgi:hypothetical protein
MSKILPGIISKKSVVEPHPLDKAAQVSYDAFDAFRAAQTGLDESNGILEEFAASQEALIAHAKNKIAEANAQVAKNNALATKLAEFTG